MGAGLPSVAAKMTITIIISIIIIIMVIMASGEPGITVIIDFVGGVKSETISIIDLVGPWSNLKTTKLYKEHIRKA